MASVQTTRRTRHPALGWVLGCSMLVLPMTASAQATFRPASRPIVTAENERWYLEGQPITFSGSFYYPAGPAVFFNPYEMVPSGSYRGIPLYAMKTREPYDVVYVPLSGGLLQPYERRREGDLAGTVGSSAPSFPVERDSEAGSTDAIPQAAGPPVFVDVAPVYEDDAEEGIGMPARPARTSGIGAPSSPKGSLRTAKKPTGLNAFYIEYNGRQWLSDGPTVLLDASRFTRTGDYHGFPVYVVPGDQRERVYVAVARGVGGLLTPYSPRE